MLQHFLCLEFLFFSSSPILYDPFFWLYQQGPRVVFGTKIVSMKIERLHFHKILSSDMAATVVPRLILSSRHGAFIPSCSGRLAASPAGAADVFQLLGPSPVQRSDLEASSSIGQWILQRDLGKCLIVQLVSHVLSSHLITSRTTYRIWPLRRTITRTVHPDSRPGTVPST